MNELVPPPADAPLILVADDVPANVELLFDQLHVLGFRAIAAGDGPSALRTCFEQQPDLCILDVSMPAGDLGVDDRSTGFEVCRRIKRDPRTARIPVIFVTALNDTTDRVKAIEAGGDDFLTKPHNRLVLGARVRSLLKLKAATDALEESLRKQKELEKVRDDLMKMIVHDLKSPLTSVIGAMEMLIDGDFGPLTGDQRSALGEAESRAEDLLALIEDLLEVARLEETRLALHLAPLAPGALLTEMRHEWEMRFQQEKATAVVEVADDAPVIEADHALMKRVFSNLIQNALAHSARSVTVTLGARRENSGTLFTVADDGVGIPAEYHDIIFRKFEQVKTPHIPRVRSSGLGLAFCKLVVEAHGGRIWVKSGGDMVGSAFHLWLPLRPPASSAPIGTSGAAASHEPAVR
ncbi:MAG: ATP-binding region ATPase domain protein [Gemmatimonadetes bacterium]|nr:ATP-binding region ATPase domain protein [Gemmatimonadota bacterium]